MPAALDDDALVDYNIAHLNVENKGNLGVAQQKIRGYPRSKIKIVFTYGNNGIKNSGIYQGNPSNDAGVSQEMKTISNLNIAHPNVENKGKVDGVYYTAVATPDSKAGVIAIESAFMSKEKGSTGTVLNMEGNSPQVTS